MLEELQISQHVTDASPSLLKFCQTIEKIFTSGIVAISSTLGFVKCLEAWDVFKKLAQNKRDGGFQYRNSVEHVKKHRNVFSNIGKLRLLIRYALVNKCLYAPVEYIKETSENKLYCKNSILGDDILTEILLSVLRQISKIDFKLKLKAASFLDSSWHIPEVFSFELVPANSIGVSVSFAGEKAVIVDVRQNSILAEIGNVQIGDVLDELNGVHICAATKGRLGSILKINKTQPITVTIIKAVYTDTKKIFPPIVSLLKEIHLDPDSLACRSLTNGENPLNNKRNARFVFEFVISRLTLLFLWLLRLRNASLSARGAFHYSLFFLYSSGHRTVYLGSIEIGNKGDVKQIDKAAMVLVSPYKKTGSGVKRKNVVFEIGELGVKVIDVESSDVILKHAFMEISSCGSVSYMCNYFAYISGDQNVSDAATFTCHIFQCNAIDTTYRILQSIGQGFQRTNYAV